MEPRDDRRVAPFFKKVLNTISWGLLWLLTTMTAGIYHQYAFPSLRPLGGVIAFYGLAVISFILLVRYYRRIWKNEIL